MKTKDAIEFEYIFNPRGVALVGASTDNGFLHALTNKKIKDKLYLVNPKYSELSGKKCYATILDIKETIDYVIIAAPALQVPKVLAECIEKGVKTAHIYTAGFSETGPEERKRLENEVKGIAKDRIRLISPNGMGMYG